MDEQELLKKLDALLDKLVLTAQELETISYQVISKEEIMPLQQKQDDLVAEILTANTQLKELMGSKSLNDQSPIRQKIRDKLHTFQQLNTHFVDNLANSHGLIKFEFEKLLKKKEEETGKD